MTSRRAVLRSIPLVLGIATRPRPARAQEPGRTYRFGALFNSPRDAPQNVAFFDELRRAGFVDVKVDGFGLRTERFVLGRLDEGVYHRVELTRDVHRRAEQFLLSLPETPLRAADTLHLALATSARAPSLASFDARLAAAARAAGLAIYPA